MAGIFLVRLAWSKIYYNLNLTNRRMPNGIYGGVRGQQVN